MTSAIAINKAADVSCMLYYLKVFGYFHIRPAICPNGHNIFFVTTFLLCWSNYLMKLFRQIQPEDELLKKAALGDPAGIAYLVNTYKDFAFTIAMGIVSNREDAEEVVQDSFVKAFAALRKFNNNAKFSSWLYKIVYNTSITKIQYRKPQPVPFETQYAAGLPGFSENQSWDALIATERKKYVTLLLNELAAEDRTIITLHYIAEKSIGEICDILGMNKSAIKMRLLRGRKQLEAALQLLLDQEKRNLL